MQTRLEITSDGSHTLFVPELNEHYHSTFGAIQESSHIFIRFGFDTADKKIIPLRILEIGFGTGLNAFLTCLNAEQISRQVHFTGVEKFPLSPEITDQLNYPQFVRPLSPELFRSLHLAGWNRETKITEHFFLHKIRGDILDTALDPASFELVYFDAFGPEVQPELWTEDAFSLISKAVRQGGILVTYSAKGSVRRALKKAGFEVEKIPGPPGKREITRAIKK